ncbi:hypothetical protein SDC9_152514 [bioreactor metagenome]|uniref:Uncharacterized protein n=1 Tax=bioreactor metagenome TaxID=1076179 RepID=A0A645EXW1_9ZZZZ
MCLGIAQHIIAVVIPEKVIWRQFVHLPVVLMLPLFLGRVFVILKGHRPLCLHRLVQHIHDGQHICVRGSAFYIKLALQLSRLMGTGQRGQPFDEVPRSVMGNESSGLYRVYQHFKLGELQYP